MQKNPRTTNSLPFLFAVYFSVPRLAFSSEKISRESLGFIFFLSFSLKLPTNLRWSVRIEILYRGSQSCQENIMNVARISKTYPQRRRWATHIAPLVCLWGACGPELQQRGIFSIVYNRSFIWKKTISVLRRHKWWDLNERWTTIVKVIKEIKGAESRHSSAHNRYVKVPSTSNCEWESLVWSIASIWEIWT